jgi:hypothetical protein
MAQHFALKFHYTLIINNLAFTFVHRYSRGEVFKGMLIFFVIAFAIISLFLKVVTR